MDRIEAFDHGASHNFRFLHWPWLVPVVQALGWLGDSRFIAVLLVGAALLWMMRGKSRPAVVLLGVGLGAFALTGLLKVLVERPRPALRWALDHPDGYSFPSAHALLSAAVYGTLAVLLTTPPGRRRWRSLAVGLATLLALGSGFSRLFAGTNYATDVLAGWLLGTLLAVLAGQWIDRETHAPASAPGP